MRVGAHPGRVRPPQKLQVLGSRSLTLNSQASPERQEPKICDSLQGQVHPLLLSCRSASVCACMHMHTHAHTRAHMHTHTHGYAASALPVGPRGRSPGSGQADRPSESAGSDGRTLAGSSTRSKRPRNAWREPLPKLTRAFTSQLPRSSLTLPVQVQRHRALATLASHGQVAPPPWGRGLRARGPRSPPLPE